MSFGRKDPSVFKDPEMNRRGGNRRRVLKGAKIVFNDNKSVLDVTIRDLSETGARVKLDPSAVMAALPEGEITLKRGNVGLSAWIMWARNQELGLRFVEGAVMDVEHFLRDAPGLIDLVNRVAPNELIHHLSTLHFFNDPELESASADLRSAYDRVLQRVRAASKVGAARDDEY